MQFQEAEKIFSSKGFRRKVVPSIASYLFLFSAIAFAGLKDVNDVVLVTIVFAVVLVVVIVPLTLRYRTARQKHEAFKVRFGEIYIKFVEDGSISLTSASILMSGSPDFHETRLEKEQKRQQGPSV